MKKIILGILLLMILLLAACTSESGKGKQPGDTPESNDAGESESSSEEETAEDTYANVFPFTGEPTNDPVDHRALAVMVNNHSKARPQTGLSQADIVYELLAEGEITRFLAVFHSTIPDEVGPVRSARPYYFNLAKAHDAIYTYHGAANFIDEQIRNDGHDYLNGATYDNDGRLFKRDNTRKAPHNSYLLTEGVASVADRKGYESSRNIAPFTFTNEKTALNSGGKEVSDLKIIYSERFDSTVSYAYDSKDGKYMRYSDGKRTEERDDNVPIKLANVLIIETSHQVIDSAGRRDIDLISGGKGYLLQAGKLREITWKNESGRIIPYAGDEKAGMLPGRTWVNVIPSSPGLEQSVSYRVTGE
ncbi:putative lipoprotein YerB [Thalassobacillus devorans]|uniref:Lipoprotein YerB n=1 Tax=Thalassobacillus devorans TaxID=279813 RepID=A0ABQ1PJM8_9BACI|nr:DUF3048 domain-containing protein [Thalassobacillus devorans]NIK30106.1 hypothetical protein [Thalassobacillus devorans]GGC98391.1 putative lipoprotein YerB [Thalassobacillus devorans]